MTDDEWYEAKWELEAEIDALYEKLEQVECVVEMAADFLIPFYEMLVPGSSDWLKVRSVLTYSGRL